MIISLAKRPLSAFANVQLRSGVRRVFNRIVRASTRSFDCPPAAFFNERIIRHSESISDDDAKRDPGPSSSNN